MKEIIIKYISVTTLIILLWGCLDERLTPELNLKSESAIELLSYLESHGDYINSEEINEFVSASEVYANRSSYLIIDVRPQSDYVLGHVENAINVEPKNLLNFIKSKNCNIYPKIVIISESGQSAAYYTALLKLAGFPNVFTMEYGMAAWHQNFADIWLNATRDFRAGTNHFTNEEYPKPDFTNLPVINSQNTNKSVKEKLEERIITLLAAGFDENLVDTSNFPKYSISSFEDGNASIVVETVYSNYSSQSNSFTNHFVLCFGSTFLYRANKLNGPFADQGHLPSAVHYLPMIDLRSTNNLQTTPTNKIVAVYDVNGQVSPKIVAYLRLLGYNAKSMLFGANTLFYSRVLWVESLAPFAFKQELIMNLPYVTGS
jgi:rhodanese-related sulfurtransferase